MTDQKTGSIKIGFKEALETVKFLIDTVDSTLEGFLESDVECLKMLVGIINKLLTEFPSAKDSLDGPRVESWERLKTATETGQLLQRNREVLPSVEDITWKIPKETLDAIESKSAEELADEIVKFVQEVYPELSELSSETMGHYRIDTFGNLFRAFWEKNGITSKFEVPARLRIKMDRAEFMAGRKIRSCEGIKEEESKNIARELETKGEEELADEILKKTAEVFPQFKTDEGRREMLYDGGVFRNILNVFLEEKGIKHIYGLHPKLQLKLKGAEILVRTKIRSQVPKKEEEIPSEVLGKIQEVSKKYQDVPPEELAKKVLEFEKAEMQELPYGQLRVYRAFTYRAISDYFKEKEKTDVSLSGSLFISDPNLREFRTKLYQIDEIVRKELPKIKSEIEQEKRSELLNALEPEFREWAKDKKIKRVSQRTIDLFIASREQPTPREIAGLLYEKLRT